MQRAKNTAIGKTQWMVCGAAFLGWLFDGFEMGLFPIVARPALMDMYPGQGEVDAYVGQWMGWITAVFLLGAAAGGFLFGFLGDRLGRVKAMTLSILTYSIFTGMGYFAQSPWDLAGYRFLASLGMGGEWSLGVALVMESWPERWRPLMAGVIGAAANFGFLLVGAVGKIRVVTQDDWRWMWLVGIAPAGLVFLIRLFIPESEKWKTAKANSKGHSPIREVLSPPTLRWTLLAVCFSSIALIGTWGSVQWIPVWVDQLAGETQPTAKAEVAMLSAMGAILGCVSGPLIGGRLGRRPAFFGLCFASLVVCGVLFRVELDYGTTFKCLVFFAGMTTAAFYGWFPLYLPELFPTRCRATGQGIGYNMGRIMAAGCAIGSGQLVAVFDGDYARMGAVITLVYLVGMIVIWWAPETKGKPLPE